MQRAQRIRFNNGGKDNYNINCLDNGSQYCTVKNHEPGVIKNNIIVHLASHNLNEVSWMY